MRACSFSLQVALYLSKVDRDKKKDRVSPAFLLLVVADLVVVILKIGQALWQDSATNSHIAALGIMKALGREINAQHSKRIADILVPDGFRNVLDSLSSVTREGTGSVAGNHIGHEHLVGHILEVIVPLQILVNEVLAALRDLCDVVVEVHSVSFLSLPFLYLYYNTDLPCGQMFYFDICRKMLLTPMDKILTSPIILVDGSISLVYAIEIEPADSQIPRRFVLTKIATFAATEGDTLNVTLIRSGELNSPVFVAKLVMVIAEYDTIDYKGHIVFAENLIPVLYELVNIVLGPHVQDFIVVAMHIFPSSWITYIL